MKKKREDNWMPACGGTEVPFTTRSGRRLWYMWNTRNGDHAYLDCITDMILTDTEAWNYLYPDARMIENKA